MSTSFLVRKFDIAVDESTWPKNAVNKRLKVGSGRVDIDLGEALHELGTITMPNILSPASPALFWAWLRYYLAPSKHPDLRLTMDFSDLDPHQKGILSDDFGVALATHWVRTRLGPFTQIVDGRKFANQFKDLQRKQHKSKAKVGMSKAPRLHHAGRDRQVAHRRATWAPAAVFALQMSELSLGHRQVA
jgi:hypothetical protein